MHKHNRSSRLMIAGMLVALASALPAASALAAPAQQGNGPQNSAAQSPRAYVPIVFNNWPANTLFGIETSNYTASQNALSNSGATWIRRNALNWNAVEASPGQRNWDAGLDADMINASKNGQKVILIIHGTPVWARTVPSSNCSPILPAQLPAFANFVRDAVTRYSKPPYNVKYWELWNEPDGPTAANVDQPWGCWGNTLDPYFGGRDYANMLKVVSPQIRQADPQAKIVLAGLLLNCKPGTCASLVNQESQYLEGIIIGGGTPHFDVVNFHAYDFWDAAANTVGRYNGPGQWGTNSTNTGPVLIAKARFVKGELSRLGVTGKQLVNTEVGLLCWQCGSEPANFATSKAYYVPQAYAAAIAEGLSANVWYSYEGWESSNLTGQAMDAFKVALGKMGDATFAGDIASGDVGSSGVMGYKFNRAGKNLWVLWSKDGGAKSVTLPGTPAKITDALGANQPASASFQLTVKPLYVEFP